MDLISDNNNRILSAPQHFFNASSSNQLLDNQTINQIWTKENFDNHKRPDKHHSYYTKSNLVLDLKTTWAHKEEGREETMGEDEEEEEEEVAEEKERAEPPADASVVSTPEKESPTSTHHARRPMNAFLIFCKKHRPVVRKKYPNLENRGVTRILGEWWALLEEDEKGSYKELALQYKDAFLSANPNFKWYKLPAPPLRTTNPRLPTASKATPLLSPTHSITSTEFTPGKLADETQLGNLTLLMNLKQNYVRNEEIDSKKDCAINYNNNNNNNEETLAKPLKKRKYVNVEPVCTMLEMDSDEEANNMTQQELMNKVVDSMFTDDGSSGGGEQHSPSKQEVRKSGRACKGRRYAEFMMEGNLLGNKQMKLFTSKLDVKNKFELALNHKIEDFVHNKTAKLDLSDTIKRLAERTNTRLEDLDMTDNKPKRTESENSDEGAAIKIQASFNLDQRIAELPGLSYEVYLQRKKESKKRKPLRFKGELSPHKSRNAKTLESSPVGSKKRKNKSSITRLGKPEEHSPYMTNFNTDLLGLATLAEVAANIEKIN